METKKIEIKNKLGLHASLCAKIVQIASKYSADMQLNTNDKTYDLKSILGLMSSAVCYGDNIMISAEGKDASNAIKAVTEVIQK